MNLIRPHVFVLAAAVKAPLQLPVTYLYTTVPRGSFFRLDYILADYPRTVVAGAQTSPNLLFRLLDARGSAHTHQPTPFLDVTTPVGLTKIRGVQGWRLVYSPGEVIAIEITGQVAGPIPATISISYLGQKGWGQR